MNIHEEINQNMTVSTGGAFELNNDELEKLRNNQVWTNSRANRRKPGADKTSQRINAQDWINSSNQLQVANTNVIVQQMTYDENRELIKRNNQINKNSSENIPVDTLRENMRNSQESLRTSSSENILQIEENMRKNSVKPSNNNQAVDTDISNVQLRHPSKLGLVNAISNRTTGSGSTDTLNGSTVDVYQSPTSPTTKDAHTAFIDLSNNCRQFYFNHLKNAEAIKQSIRTQKHSTALNKVNGKSASRIDLAMDRLRSEMADLMDQDLSLMSQLLTLNDKIEEIKNHVRNSAEPFSQSLSYLSNGDVTDNEYSDLEESGIFHRDFSIRRHSAPQTTPVRSVVTASAHNSIPEADDDTQDEAEPRKVEPSEREIIVYRKKKGRRRSKSDKMRSRNNSSAEDSEATDEDSGDTDDAGSHSDTDSTIGGNSADEEAELTETDTREISETTDSGVQSQTQSKEPEVAKPVKGGVSQNRFFLKFHKFHKKKGATEGIPGGNSVLTLTGHHIPLEKYYIPQGLVYLKHTESENVFCQFSH